MAMTSVQFKKPPVVDPARFGPELPCPGHKNALLDVAGESHSFRLNRLSINRGISLELDSQFSCDGRDLWANPLVYRLHMFPAPSQSRSLSVEEKLSRIQSWEKALQIFDANQQILTEKTVVITQALLSQFKLPTADFAEIDTEDRLLNSLFERLQFRRVPEYPNRFLVRWARLVELAYRGEIVTTWLLVEPAES